MYTAILQFVVIVFLRINAQSFSLDDFKRSDNVDPLENTLQRQEQVITQMSQELSDLKSKIASKRTVVAFMVQVPGSSQDLNQDPRIQFGNPDINIGDGWHAAVNTFVAPVSGLYVFFFKVSGWPKQPSGGVIDFVVNKDGQVIAETQTNDDNDVDRSSVQVVVQMLAGERVWVQKNGGSGHMIGGGVMSTFGGFLINAVLTEGSSQRKSLSERVELRSDDRSPLEEVAQKQQQMIDTMKADLTALTGEIAGTEHVVAFMTHAPDRQNLTLDPRFDFGNVDLNVGSGFHAATSSFIAPLTGLYCFFVKVSGIPYGTASGPVIDVALKKNGAVIAETETNDDNNDDRSSVQVVVPVVAGESLWVQKVAGGGTKVYGEFATTFGGFLISPGEWDAPPVGESSTNNRNARSDDSRPLEETVLQQAGSLTQLRADLNALQSRTAHLRTTVAFMTQLATNQSRSQHHKIQFGTADLNIGSGFQADSHTFVAPFPGIYVFFLKVAGAPIGSYTHYTQIHLLKNGKTIAETEANDDNDVDRSSVQVIVQMAAGDKVWADIASGRRVVGGGVHTTFGGFLYRYGDSF